MKRLARSLGWALLLILAFAVAAEATMYILNAQASRRAESLLKDVRTMKPAVTTGEEVELVVGRYGGDVGRRAGNNPCASIIPRWKPYAVVTRSEILDRVGLFDRLHGTAFRQFGASLWEVRAYFGVDGKDRLACVAYQIDSFPARSESARAAADYRLAYDASDSSKFGVAYNNIHSQDSLGVEATTSAKPSQRAGVFDFDLACLTRSGGCRVACELMPSAWIDYQKEARANGWPLPAEDASDPRCAKLSAN